MEMHEIRYFLAACHTLNFHKAAELAHVSQPALTRAMQKLEAELGGHLFHREKGHVQLTGFGRLMRTHLDEIHQRSETAKATARNFHSLEAAPVTLGVMCTIGPLRFVGFLNWFRARYPGIEVTVIEGAAGQLAELLEEGKLDIAVIARPEPFSPDLNVEPLYKERFGLAFCTGHPLERCNTVTITDVQGENYLERINCEFGDHIDQLCSLQGFEIRSAFRGEREDWILAMVAAGMGVCFIAEFSSTHPGVCHRPIVDPEIIREVSLVSVRGRAPSPAVSAFATGVRAYEW